MVKKIVVLFVVAVLLGSAVGVIVGGHSASVPFEGYGCLL